MLCVLYFEYFGPSRSFVLAWGTFFPVLFSWLRNGMVCVPVSSHVSQAFKTPSHCFWKPYTQTTFYFCLLFFPTCIAALKTSHRISYWNCIWFFPWVFTPECGMWRQFSLSWRRWDRTRNITILLSLYHMSFLFCMFVFTEFCVLLFIFSLRSHGILISVFFPPADYHTSRNSVHLCIHCCSCGSSLYFIVFVFLIVYLRRVTSL